MSIASKARFALATLAIAGGTIAATAATSTPAEAHRYRVFVGAYRPVVFVRPRYIPIVYFASCAIYKYRLDGVRVCIAR